MAERQTRCSTPVGAIIAAFLCMAASVLGAGVGSARPGTIESLAVQPYFFSPAKGDSVTFRFSLADTAAVFLFVVEKDSTTVADTLVAGTVLSSGAVRRAAWHGVYFNGVPAPQDTFLAYLKTDTGTEIDSLYSPLFFIDSTSPQVFITLVDPGLIVPGSSDPAQSPDVEITCAVADPPPSDSLEVDVVVYGPEGDEADALPERLVAANGSFKSVWNGESATDDGLHAIEVTVRDRASNSARARSYVDVDTEGPTVTVTSPKSGTTIRELPDSLHGWSWDRHGVRDSISVEYPNRTTFVLIESTYTRDDTLFFAAVLRDSIAEEGRLAFRFASTDGVGQIRNKGYEVTWDGSAPPAPVLEPLPAVTHSPFVVLDGTVGGNQADVMRIYRNDELADTLFPKIEGKWPHTLAVEPGPNRIRAVMTDAAGNVSPPSNTVETTYDPSSGFYFPQPFRPGDAFQVNLAGDTRGMLTVRIFDLAGHAVRVLEKEPTSGDATITWDGINGDGEKVKKGPLVAVATVDYADGKKETHREVLLFEP